MKLSLTTKRILSSRLNTMACNNLRPAVFVSMPGKPGLSIYCNNTYKVKEQIDISKQTQVLLKDVERCIEHDPVGCDDCEYIDSFFLVYKPDLP